MAGRRKEQMEFRYYELEEGMPVLALMGDNWKKEYGKDGFCLHFHNYLEIGRCHYGEGTVIINDMALRFSPGSLTMIPQNIPHTTVSDKGDIGFWEYLFVDAEAFLRDIYQDDLLFARALSRRIESGAHLIEEEDQPEIAMLVKAIFQEMAERRELYKEKIKGLLLSLLLEIARFGTGEYVQSCSTQITAALRYIEEHYSEPMKMKDLAEICHMSETNFRRLFGEIMNMTPLKYLNLIRVEAACELIQRGQLSITEIAEQTGFGAQVSLSRNFKELLGVSPREWKKNPGKSMGREKYKVSALRGWY